MKKFILTFCIFFSFLLFNDANAQVKYQWAKGIGTSNGDLGSSIVADDSGNVYVTGLLGNGTTNFNPFGTVPFPLTSTGSIDCFLAKYNAGGNCLWAKTFPLGTLSSAFGTSIALDEARGVYITGGFLGQVNFNPAGAANLTSASGSSTDGFLAKYDTWDGSFNWAKQLACNNNNLVLVNSIVVDKAGNNVYITGTFQGSADFDPSGTGNTLVSAGMGDVFFATFNKSNGHNSMAKRIGSTNSDMASSIALDVTGNIYLTGAFQGTVAFNPGGGDTLISKGGSDIFFAKYNSLGNCLWAKSIGSSSEDGGASIAIDAADNVYLTGYFQGKADFDPDPAAIDTLKATGARDIFFAKYDNTGGHTWAKSIRGYSNADSAGGLSIGVDRIGNVYLAGYLKGSANFDPNGGDRHDSNGMEDIFFAKYTDVGDLDWAKNIGSSGQDAGTCIAVDTGGNVYLTGYFQDTVDFDPHDGIAKRMSIGSRDIFFEKFRQGTSEITGTVRKNGVPVNNGNAKLYTKTTYNAPIHLADVTPIDPQTGVYTFYDVPADTYIILALADSSDCLPTYNGNFTHWNQATPINIGSNTNITVDISLSEYSALNGHSKIGGTITEGVGFGRNVGEPIQGVPIGLEGDPGSIMVSHTTTDDNGYYTFDNVPNNCYKIYVHIPGLPTTHNYHVCPTTSDSIMNLNFVADSSSIDTVARIPNSVLQMSLSKTKVLIYPNPNRGFIDIEFTLSETNLVQLDVYNLLGEKVAGILNEKKQAGIIKYGFNSTNAGLKAGIYLLKLKIGTEINSIKMIQVE